MLLGQERKETNMDWQPIETAPRDEDEYIVGRMGILVLTMLWDEDDAKWFTVNDFYERVSRYRPEMRDWEPTHWTVLDDLPEPPKEEGE